MNLSGWIKIELEIPKNSTLHRCMDWCNDEFGNKWDMVKNIEGKWCAFWAGPKKRDYYRFHFKHEADAVLFALRWS